MPDLERLTDDLAVHLACTPEEKAYVNGFIAGKRLARRQVLMTAVFFAGTLALIGFAGIARVNGWSPW